MKFNKVPTWFPHFNCLCLLSYLNCKKQKRRLIHLPSKQRKGLRIIWPRNERLLMTLQVKRMRLKRGQETPFHRLLCF
uniref:Uncharacterized protein n=1 Tax=Salix viminalis TaxID=40686 RepID=A0A6N2LBS7_SALVM